MNSLSRRNFLHRTAAASLALGSFAPSALAYARPEKNAISLATWSIVRSFRAGVWKLTDVARICREDLGIDGIEYVNQFFEVPTQNYLNQLNKTAADHGVQNVLIMVDQEGSMVAKDKKERHQAVINHRKWVDIAAYLGCHAIRCNAHGGGRTPEEDPDALDRAAESFSELLDYAKEAKINVIIENHGGLSSAPGWLPALMKKVDNPNFGLLPDYGNYAENADRYKEVKESMPYAKGVSVKAGWQADGTHPQYDLEKLLQISLDAGYTGFWGIESSMRGDANSPEEIKKIDWQGVLLTKKVIEKVVFKG
ncbi:MAG: sugar phosphate isomerase/epimerase [Candidatus Omnitrophica bacterium]|nr:sugar phosphate isomerase/epimerase [Candidatus Omnitrophota bacterium]